MVEVLTLVRGLTTSLIVLWGVRGLVLVCILGFNELLVGFPGYRAGSGILIYCTRWVGMEIW